EDCCGFLCFVAEPAGAAADDDADEGEGDAGDGDPAGGGCKCLPEFTGGDDRDHGPEGGEEPGGDGEAEGQADIANGHSPGEAAESPEETEGVGGGDGLCRRRVEHAEEMRGGKQGEQHRQEEPGDDTLYGPAALPGPAFHPFEGHIAATGGEAAEDQHGESDENVHMARFYCGGPSSVGRR